MEAVKREEWHSWYSQDVAAALLVAEMEEY